MQLGVIRQSFAVIFTPVDHAEDVSVGAAGVQLGVISTPMSGTKDDRACPVARF
jgi:hypothetical protein